MLDYFAFVQKNFAWVIAVASFIVAVFVAWLNYRRSQKAFTYEVISNTQLVSKSKGAKGKIEILYEGKPVNNVRLIVILLTNSGGKELEPKDFIEPVRLVFPDGTEFYEADVVVAHPKGFKPDLEQDRSSFVLKPTLMNPGDRVVFKFLAAVQGTAHFDVTGRISGVKQILEASDDPTYAKRIGTVILLFFVLFSVLYVVIVRDYRDPLTWILSIIIVAVMITDSFLTKKAERERSLYRSLIDK